MSLLLALGPAPAVVPGDDGAQAIAMVAVVAPVATMTFVPDDLPSVATSTDPFDLSLPTPQASWASVAPWSFDSVEVVSGAFAADDAPAPWTRPLDPIAVLVHLDQGEIVSGAFAADDSSHLSPRAIEPIVFVVFDQADLPIAPPATMVDEDAPPLDVPIPGAWTSAPPWAFDQLERPPVELPEDAPTTWTNSLDPIAVLVHFDQAEAVSGAFAADESSPLSTAVVQESSTLPVFDQAEAVSGAFAADDPSPTLFELRRSSSAFEPWEQDQAERLPSVLLDDSPALDRAPDPLAWATPSAWLFDQAEIVSGAFAADDPTELLSPWAPSSSAVLTLFDPGEIVSGAFAADDPGPLLVELEIPAAPFAPWEGAGDEIVSGAFAQDDPAPLSLELRRSSSAFEPWEQDQSERSPVPSPDDALALEQPPEREWITAAAWSFDQAEIVSGAFAQDDALGPLSSPWAPSAGDVLSFFDPGEIVSGAFGDDDGARVLSVSPLEARAPDEPWAGAEHVLSPPAIDGDGGSLQATSQVDRGAEFDPWAFATGEIPPVPVPPIPPVPPPRPPTRPKVRAGMPAKYLIDDPGPEIEDPCAPFDELGIECPAEIAQRGEDEEAPKEPSEQGIILVEVPVYVPVPYEVVVFAPGGDEKKRRRRARKTEPDLSLASTLEWFLAAQAQAPAPAPEVAIAAPLAPPVALPTAGLAREFAPSIATRSIILGLAGFGFGLLAGYLYFGQRRRE